MGTQRVLISSHTLIPKGFWTLVWPGYCKLWPLPPDFPCSSLSFSPDAYYLQYEMLVLIDIGRTWLKFISHSLLLLQRYKGFLVGFFPPPSFFNPENRKPSYLCGVKHETGSLFEKQHLMFSSLFNSDNWALLYYAAPVSLPWDFVMSGAADSWQTAMWRAMLPLTKFLTLQSGERRPLSQTGRGYLLRFSAFFRWHKSTSRYGGALHPQAGHPLELTPHTPFPTFCSSTAAYVLQIINCRHCPKSQQMASQFCIPGVQPINNNWKCDTWLKH